MRVREGDVKMETEIRVTTQGIQAASRSRKMQGTDSVLEPLEGTQLCGYLELDP